MRWISVVLALGLTMACSPKKTSEDALPKVPQAASEVTPKVVPEVARKKPTETKTDDGDQRHEDDDVLAQLVGIWRVDLDALANDPAITKLPAKDREAALALARQTLRSMAFEYAADGKLRVFLGSQVRTGTYRIEGSDDAGVSVTTVLGTGASKIESKSKIQFDQGAAVVTEEGQPTLRLVRGIPTPPGTPPPQ